MLNINQVTIFLLMLVTLIEPATAIDLRIQPRFKTGIQFYEFEQPAFQFPARDIEGKFPNTQSKLELSDWLPFVSGGTTLFIDRFFVDFDAQYLFDGQANSNFSSQSFIKAGEGVPTDTVLINNGALNVDFDRFEWAISAGFEVIDNLVIFGGYKHAKTKTTSSDIQGDFITFLANDINRTPIPLLTGRPTGEIGIEFEYDGPFVGMNYSWKIQQGFMNGGLSFNFAAAFLDSETNIDVSNLAVKSITGVTVPLDIRDNQLKELKGDSTGFSFGVGWQGLTSVKGLTYLVGVTGYHYEFEGNKTVENRVRLDFGLAYAIDF